MIETTKALETCLANIDRTNALIDAMDKIDAYNRLYQMRESVRFPENAKIITKIQSEQLAWIEQSCGEHAIISLATAFETYCKELVQELLADYPDFFLLQDLKNKSQLRDLVESEDKFTYEEISEILGLSGRKTYYQFFEKCKIPFLTEQELEFVEYIYLKRNNYAHNAGKLDKKTRNKLQAISLDKKESKIKTEAKRLRTKFVKMINAIHKRILSVVDTK